MNFYMEIKKRYIYVYINLKTIFPETDKTSSTGQQRKQNIQKYISHDFYERIPHQKSLVTGENTVVRKQYGKN